MKRIITTILLLGAVLLHAQPKVTYQAYLPLRTYHFNRSNAQMEMYTNTEGGNIGFIAGRKVQYEKFFIETNAGAIINSFGELSIIATQGIGITENENFLDISIALGFATGYKKLYDGVKAPEFFVKNGIAPVATVNLSMHQGIKISSVRVSPMIIVSTMYVNGGIKITK